MAYFDKDRNARVRFADLRKVYNLSLTTSVDVITPDIAQMLSLYQIAMGTPPEHDPEMFGVMEDKNQDPIFDEERMTVSWPWKIVEKYPAELDEDGNVVKTSEEVKAAQEAEAAAAAAREAEQAEEAEAQRLIEEVEDEIAMNRITRNVTLLATDVYMVPDYPHADDSAKQAWVDYRVTLRDAFDGITSETHTLEEVREHWAGILATAPDYVAPEEPTEEVAEEEAPAE